MTMTRFEAKCWRDQINEGLRKAGRVEAGPRWQWNHGLLTLEEYLDDVISPADATMTPEDVAADLDISVKGLREWGKSRGFVFNEYEEQGEAN